MKRALVLAILVVAAIACSTLQTSYDYDKSVNFSQYKTWSLKDDGSIKNPLLFKRFEAAVTDEMTKKGLTRSDSNPDLWVAAHTRLSKETRVNTYDTGWGYGYGWRGGYAGGGMTTSTVQDIPVGTLIVDLADAHRKELVWRGQATDTLNPNSSPEEKEANLRAAIAKMFENYPPGAVK
jgi:Domain of unknown function (DUF4136)